MDDGAAPLAAQQPGAHQRREEVAGDEAAAVVDGEEAVAVAVEGETRVGALGHDPALQLGAVLLLHGVEAVVGQGAVGVEVHPRQLHGQARVDALEDRADHAVAGVGDDPQGPQAVDLHQGEDLVDEPLAEVEALHPAGAAGRAPLLGLDQPPQVLDALVPGQQVGHLPHHLEAAVLGRVVGGGDHDPRPPAGGAGVVVLVGADHAEVEDVRPLESEPLHEGGADGRARQAHVAADDDLRRLQQGGEGPPHGEGRGLVELGGVEAADVVGLEDGGIDAHAVSLAAGRE